MFYRSDVLLMRHILPCATHALFKSYFFQHYIHIVVEEANGDGAYERQTKGVFDQVEDDDDDEHSVDDDDDYDIDDDDDDNDDDDAVRYVLGGMRGKRGGCLYY